MRLVRNTVKYGFAIHLCNPSFSYAHCDPGEFAATGGVAGSVTVVIGSSNSSTKTVRAPLAGLNCAASLHLQYAQQAIGKCPAGMSFIETEAECLAAAAELGLAFSRSKSHLHQWL